MISWGRVQISLSQSQADHLQQLAIIEGFKRVNPRKRWTDIEKKEAIRFVLLKLTGADRFADNATP